MNHFPRFSVTVRLGERAREVSARELSPEVRKALLEFILVRPVIHSRSGTYSPKVLSGPNDNGIKQSFPESFGTERDSSVSHQREHELIHTRAGHLADALQDHTNIAWYVQVAETLRGDEIQDALALARDVPMSRLRTTRARYFTALVRDRVKARRNSNHSYAQ